MHRRGTLTRRALLGGLAAGAVGVRTGWWPSEAEGAAPQKPVVIAQGTDPPTLDPQFAESGDLANIENELFSRLIAYDSQMRISPDLATSFQVMPDQVTWQFKLRPGVTFWNGEPVDARAVKYTFDRVGDQALRKQGLDDPYYGRVGFDHLTIVDNYTVNFVLKEPSIVFPVYTTFNPILAPGYYSSHTPAETAIQPMGSGPWMFDEWVKDDHLRLRANPRYWRGKPQVDTLIFRIAPDASTRMAMLETSEVDLVADLSPDDVARVEGRSTLRVSKAIGGRRVNISIPTQNPIFKDRRVRQAMNLAVDFDTINKTLLRGVAFGRMAVPVNGVTWIDPKTQAVPVRSATRQGAARRGRLEAWDRSHDQLDRGPVREGQRTRRGRGLVPPAGWDGRQRAGAGVFGLYRQGAARTVRYAVPDRIRVALLWAGRPQHLHGARV